MATSEVGDQQKKFYLACCNGDTEYVRHNIPQMTLEEINHIENGDSALHAASRQGHAEIVRLLLERGACRQQLDKNNQVPRSVASSNDVRILFNRSPSNAKQRFLTTNPKLEWNFRSKDYTSPNRLFFVNSIARVSAPIRAVSLELRNDRFKDCPGIEQIKYFIDHACDSYDIECLLRAYTAETGFYSSLNGTLAESDHVYGYLEYIDWAKLYAAQMCRGFFQDSGISFQGVTYRGMKTTRQTISEYIVGEAICNKSFLSTSKSRSVAESFIGSSSSDDQPEDDTVSVICQYTIRNARTALDLQSVSEYPEEEEVLIIPMSYFFVESVTNEANGTILIELDEYVNESSDSENEDGPRPMIFFYKTITRSKKTSSP